MHSHFVLRRIMKERLNLYHVDMKYIRDLHRVDDKVPSVSPQIGKETRVFLGVFHVKNRKYVIPLSHAESKHEKMAPKADFEKVYDAKGRLIAVLNINLMIPVEESQLIPIDLRIHKTDSGKIKAYKYLCINEINFCRKVENEKKIADKVRSLYDLCNKEKSKTDKTSEYRGKKRCVNFKKAEAVCDRFNEKHDTK